MKHFLVTILLDETVVESYVIESTKQPTKKQVINKIHSFSYAITNGLENLEIREQTIIKM